MTIYCRLSIASGIMKSAASVKATFDVLLGNTNIEDPLGQPQPGFKPPDISSLVESIKRMHNLP